jgi:hypothetical protein
MFRIYQRAAKRRQPLTGERLQAFDRALEWAGIGRETAAESLQVPAPEPAREAEIRVTKLNFANTRL